ncbi:unnamed protein product [Ostreobium quekettii]|uniref:Uncharacterized protein n=1 Tax=Ostreobium quekettii TaxID=121088 RepID=A0A8S1IVC2_9CHLO|nr:unnamed protein product [Ostreobium quekettii]CAD7697896.1 unnamed protein product [Ostreobium quekettii]
MDPWTSHGLCKTRWLSRGGLRMSQCPIPLGCRKAGSAAGEDRTEAATPWEITNPCVFWYEAAVKADPPFIPLGLAACQAFAMHCVEVRRWRDLRKPGSVKQEPVFSNFSLPDHEPG